MNGEVAAVQAGPFTLDCLKFGGGDEALVILPGVSVPSVMGAADAITRDYAALAGRFAVHLLDYRADPPDPYPVRTIAQDVSHALQTLGLNRVNLFGASLGGMVAQVLAIEHPELVGRLVLGSTAPRVTGGRWRLLERWAALAERGDALGLCLAFGEAVYPAEAFERSRAALGETAAAATGADLARFAALVRGIRGFDVADELGGIACPVLAIGSSDDRVLGPEGTLDIAARLGGRAGFEMHLYDGYGHAAYDTAPDYKDRMLRFLTA